MPAVTPAEVQTEPSRTKIGSDSTRTAGKRRASSAQYDQWVTARRPSSTPEAASRNAPVQTEATRRAFFGTLPHPIDQHRVGGSRVDARATGDHQRVQRRSGARQRAGRDPKSGRGRYALSAFRHHAQDVRRRSSGLRDVIVGGGEHLKRPRDIEQLHRRVGQHFDDARRMARTGFGGERGDFGISARACPL